MGGRSAGPPRLLQDQRQRGEGHVHVVRRRPHGAGGLHDQGPGGHDLRAREQDDRGATSTGGGGTGQPDSFTCYKLRCPKVPEGTFAAVMVQDQFGTRALTPTATSLLCAPETGPTDGGFPATGQTTCWDDNGNVISCAGTGQDGATLTGAPLAYVDN